MAKIPFIGAKAQTCRHISFAIFKKTPQNSGKLKTLAKKLKQKVNVWENPFGRSTCRKMAELDSED